MIARLRLGIAALLCALACAVPNAFANKADDTLRIAVTDWWGTLDPYQFPLDEAAVFYQTVYETLVRFDERKQEYVPRLAKSWKRDRRQDARIPAARRREIPQRRQIRRRRCRLDRQLRDRPEISDAPQGRLRLGRQERRRSGPTPFASSRRRRTRSISRPSPINSTSSIRRCWTRWRTRPITAAHRSSAPARSRSSRSTSRRWCSTASTAGGAISKARSARMSSHIVAMPIPDRQTQIAQFLTGNIDVIRNASADTARELGKMPDTRVTPLHDGQLMYVTLDAMGRSDNKVDDGSARAQGLHDGDRPQRRWRRPSSPAATSPTS